MRNDQAYVGFDIAGLMHASRAEARRVMEASKGDLVSDHEAVLDRLQSAELITGEEARTLLELYRIGFEAGEGKADVQRAFLESRSIYDRMAASGSASPVALVVASAGVGSFEVEPGDDGSLIVTMARQSYGSALAGIGAGIGAMIGGPAGGALGGAIGGLIGGIVDEKKDKKKT